MPDALQNGDRFRRAFVLFLVIGITAAFLWMIWPFLMTIVLAAIMAGLFRPLYRWLLRRTGDRGWLAAGLTVFAAVALLVVPLAIVLTLVASEALRLSEAIAPKIQELVSHPQDNLDQGCPQRFGNSDF